MRQAARFSIQVYANGRWTTYETTTSRAIAEERANTLAAETLGFGPTSTAKHYQTYPAVRVAQGGKTVYDPRSR
jgi:hypothetical protein